MNRSLNKSIICYCAAFFFEGLAFSFVPPLLARIAANTGTTLTIFAGVFVARSLTNMVLSLFCARWLEKLPVNKVIGCSLLIFTAASFLYPHTNSLYMGILSMMLFAVASTFVQNGSNSEIVRVMGENTGSVSLMTYTAMSVGAMIGPFLLRGVMSVNGNFLMTPFLALLLVIPFSIALFMLPNGKSEANPSADRSAGNDLKTPLTIGVFLAAAVYFFENVSENAIENWGATLLQRTAIAGEADAAMMTSFFYIGMLTARFSGIWLVKKFKARTILASSLLLMTLAAAGFFIAGDLRFCLLLSFLFGFGSGPIFSALMVCLAENASAGPRAIGIILACRGFGSTISHIFCGKLLDLGGINVFLTALCAALFAAFILQFFITKKQEA